MRSLIASLVAAPLVFAAVPVMAQSNPSADQIIKSLKPTGNLVGGGTRGIRLAPPSGDTGTYSAPSSATPAAASSPAPAVRPQQRTTSSQPPAAPAAASGPSVNLTVNFPNGSAELTSEARATLDELGRALASSELSAYRFRIEGHTDTVGSRPYNKSLSEQRAEAVAHYITEKYGVSATRLQAVGMGSDGLLVPTPDQTPEPRNRRVQVINLGT